MISSKQIMTFHIWIKDPFTQIGIALYHIQRNPSFSEMRKIIEILQQYLLVPLEEDRFDLRWEETQYELNEYLSNTVELADHLKNGDVWFTTNVIARMEQPCLSFHGKMDNKVLYEIDLWEEGSYEQLKEQLI
jgi:hypothetical protein